MPLALIAQAQVAALRIGQAPPAADAPAAVAAAKTSLESDAVDLQSALDCRFGGLDRQLEFLLGQLSAALSFRALWGCV
jgi:hypothetical protein